MVELLIRHGAKEWQEDREGKKPLDYARDKGVAADKDAIIELLDRPVIRDPAFKQAVVAVQTGDLTSLQVLLSKHRSLSHDRSIEPDCYPASYFSNPKLLWFVANNPTLIQTMPANIIAITEAIIDAGVEQIDLDYTLGLVMTSRPAREQNLQRPLMELLLDRGARVKPEDLFSTLGHGEREAVLALLESGMPITAPMAAGLGARSTSPACSQPPMRRRSTPPCRWRSSIAKWKRPGHASRPAPTSTRFCSSTVIRCRSTRPP